MKTLYVECFSGISGDMILGACLDLGVPLEYLQKELEKLHVDGWHLEVSKVKKQGITATYANVVLEEEEHHHHHDHENDHHHHHHHHMDEENGENSEHHHHHDHLPLAENEHHHHIHVNSDEIEHHHHHHDGEMTQIEAHHHHHHGEHGHSHVHRNLHDIRHIILDSDIPQGAKDLALQMFQMVAQAEAKVHGFTVGEVHFHEVGAVDSIVDMVGAAICFDYLKPDHIYFSHLREGQGHVTCAHGDMPVPVPATLEISQMAGIPLQITKTQGEMITPTGAAIAGVTAQEFLDAMPAMKIEKIGYGAGKKDFPHANVLRMMWGEQVEEAKEKLLVLETNLDDCTGEALGYTMEQLLEQGAKDAFFVPIYMKKNRPAVMLKALCDEKDRAKLEDVIFRHTTTIGIRSYRVERHILERNMKQVELPFGTAQVKCCQGPDGMRYYPEYESVKELLAQSGMGFSELYHAIWEKAQQK